MCIRDRFSTVSSGGGGTVSEAFKTISVSGQSNVVADGATDTLTLAGSGGMTITTTAGTDTVTFSSSTTPADDSVVTAKIADLNVTAGKLAANSVTSAKIATDAVGASEIAANSVGISELNVSDGSANQVLTTNGSGTLSFANPSSGTVTETFKTISVSGQDNVVADAATDTLTFAAGSNMTITTNASSDTITFASSGGGGSSSSFAKNTFTGDGSDTTFTLTNSISNEDNLIVFVDGVYQADNVFSVSGTTLTFATAPVNGRLIEVFQLEGGIVGSAPVIATMTGDGSDTTLSLGTTPNSENSTFVTIDGVMQHKSTYSVSGSTLTFSTAPPNGTAVEAITLVNQTTTSLQDSDGDTKIQLEESSDEDKIRFDTAGSERVIIDNSGNVGIGTSSPAEKLDVSGDIKATKIGAGISPIVPCEILSTGATSTALRVLKSGSDDSTQNNLFSVTEISGHGRLSIHDTSQNEDIRFDSNGDSYFNGGDVGIGTTSPSGKLHVSGHTSSIASIFESNGNGDTVPVQLKVKANNGTTSTQGLYGNAGSAAGDNTISLGSSGTSGVIVDNVGKTGINTTPDTLLHLKDTGGIELRLEADSNNAGQEDCFIRFYTDGKTQEGIAGMDNNNSSTLFSTNTENAMVFGTVSNLPTIFATNNTQRMQIDSGGSIFVNCTTDVGSSGALMELNNKSDGGRVINTKDNGTGSCNHITFNNNNGQVGRITTSGSGTSFVGSSDYRMKENIVYDWDAITKVKNLKPAQFNFKTNTDELVEGFIAHEAQSVVPYAVVGDKDGEEMQGMDYGKLTAILTKAIQELSVKLEAAEARITKLEG